MNIYEKINLNQQQKKAVEAETGTFLVCAGAGSGKTRIITARIANLIATYNTKPESIIALTFTNKAAKEMLERVNTILKSIDYIDISKPFVGTFHSYCLLLLRRYADYISIPQFSILDDDDQEKLIKKIITNHELSKRTTPNKILSAISGLKNSLNGIHTINQAINGIQDPFIREIALLYEHEKTICHCYDFDDLLINTVLLLKTNPLIRSSLQKTINHILVDEYQDTNRIQHTLLQLLALDNSGNQIVQSLCVVGDEDQSIYSWRGATIDNIIQFKNAFKNTELITIDQNYRSVQPILSCANKLIEHNEKRNPKNLWSERIGNDRVRIIQTQSPYQEADVIAHCITHYRRKHPLHSIAVLYRSHYQSKLIEEALIKKTIPYRIIGGIQFYKRQEIKDLVAYLRLIINPFDKIAFSRIINTPQRGLGEKSEEAILIYWQQNPFLSCFELIETIIKQNLLIQSKNTALEKFLHIFTDLNPQTPALTALIKIIEATGYTEYLSQIYDEEETEAKIQNVKELLNSFDYEESSQLNIALFVEQISLLEEMGNSKKNDNKPITLMTFHAAKGLEFDCVILPGLEETVMPANRSLYDSEALEEERRLLYVGITRAKEYTLLLNSTSRTLYGTTTEQRPSRFLYEIPATLCNQSHTKFWTHTSCEIYFTEWFSGKPFIQKNTEIIPTYNQKRTSIPLEKPKTTTYISRKEISNIKPTKVYANIEGILRPTDTNKKESCTQDQPNKNDSTTLFKKYDVVKHASFGVGIIKNIESKADGKLFLTITFGHITKKIESSFVQKN